MYKDVPKVTLLLVVRNERKYVKRALYSLLTQSYPREKTEIIVIDGFSSDGTREWLHKKIRELRNRMVNIKMYDNPGKILTIGWNIGIRKANGDIICRIDAHSEISNDYIEKGVETLLKMKKEGVVCVGGVLEHIGTSFIGKAIANLFSSIFGVGNSPFRTNKYLETRFSKPSFTDTAVYGLYWKKIFEEVGYFDENLKRNQDIELHYRIIKKGYKFVTHPEMRIKYYVRNTISKLLKKAFSDGYWVILSERSFFRHKVPMYFVSYLLFTTIFFIGGMFFRIPFFYVFLCLIPLIVYIIGDIFFSMKDGDSFSKILLLFLFPLFHISYGLGSLKGLTKKFINRTVYKFVNGKNIFEKVFRKISKI